MLPVSMWGGAEDMWAGSVFFGGGGGEEWCMVGKLLKIVAEKFLFV